MLAPDHDEYADEWQLFTARRPGIRGVMKCDAAACTAPDGTEYPVVDGILRFVGNGNYARAFGELGGRQSIREPKARCSPMLYSCACGVPRYGEVHARDLMIKELKQC